MAEGWINSLFPDKYQAYSAGTTPTQVHPLAIQVMKEVGIDISQHQAKKLNQFLDSPFDLVVTLCDSAKESCPVFTGAKKTIHHDFPDPSTETGEDQLALFRQVRDQIKDFIVQEFGSSG